MKQSIRLKDEYKGQIVKVNSRNGLTTFDTTETPETDYPTFQAIGFDFCFEPVAPTYREPILYTGVHQNKNQSTKRNRRKNGQTAKTESKKA